MTRGKKVADFRKGAVIALWKEGVNRVQIGIKLGMPRSTVGDIITEFKAPPPRKRPIFLRAVHQRKLIKKA